MRNVANKLAVMNAEMSALGAEGAGLVPLEPTDESAALADRHDHIDALLARC